LSTLRDGIYDVIQPKI